MIDGNTYIAGPLERLRWRVGYLLLRPVIEMEMQYVHRHSAMRRHDDETIPPDRVGRGWHEAQWFVLSRLVREAWDGTAPRFVVGGIWTCSRPDSRRLRRWVGPVINGRHEPLRRAAGGPDVPVPAGG